MRHILFRGVLLLALMATVGLSVSDIAQGAKSQYKTVQIIAGKADTVELSGAVSDLLVANPAVADVGTLRANRLYVVGKAIGDTNVLAYDDAGNELANISVHVRADDRNLQQTLREFFPDEKITAKTVKDNIVLSGTVSTPSVASQVRDLASRFITTTGQTLVDLMSVRGEQQVMLKVKVIEAKRSILKELGVETSFRPTLVEPSTGIGFTGEGAVAGSINGPTFNGENVGLAELTPFGTARLLMGEKGKWGPLQIALRALETQGSVNTLAEPNLTAISGETAGFLAGGEFPVPTGRDSQGNVIIEFKQFGVSLNFTPTVLSKDRIALHMSTEVSEKDTSITVTLADVEVDGLSVRRAETTVELGSGSTIMIAGLIKSDTLHALNGFPGAQNVPILGQLFKSDSFKRNETELLIIVTPFLVDSYAEPVATAAPAPSSIPISTPAPHIQDAEIVPEKTGMAQPVEPVEKVEVEPIKTPAAMPVATARKASVPKEVQMAAAPAVLPGQTPLARRFADNLRKAYGSRVPEKVGTKAGFGYIVE